MRLPTISPRGYAITASIALAGLAMIVLTGAAVRLTGSGLACEDWPTCEGSVLAPASIHSWIEYGNRLVSGAVGISTIAAWALAWRRRPYRRDLMWLSLALPLGVVAQAVLGAQTIKHDLEPGYVMSHFGLSMVILCFAVALTWRAWHEPEDLPRTPDRLAVWGTRALLPLGALLVFMGTVATASGPHPGSQATGEVVNRLTWKGTDQLVWAIHNHGRLGTLLGVSCVVLWFLLRRRGASRQLLQALATTACLIAAQGVIGAVQYYNGLPSGIVWIHIVFATLVWLSLLWAACAAGRLEPRTQPAPEPELAAPPRAASVS